MTDLVRELENLGSMDPNDPQFQKLIKKMRANPQFMNLARQIQGQSGGTLAGDPRERLREAMAAKRFQRSSRVLQESHMKKIEDKQREDEIKETRGDGGEGDGEVDGGAEEENELTGDAKSVFDQLGKSVSQSRRKKNEKLKKMAKKYGQITSDRYVEALNRLSDESKLTREQVAHERNIIALYTRQQALAASGSDRKAAEPVMKELELPEDGDLSGDDM
jgi:hypothetical protein